MTTALDIIEDALSMLQVLSPDVTLDAGETNSGLRVLNQMIDSFSIDELLVYTSTKEIFNTVAGLNPHTMGPSGTFNTVKPIAIDAIYINVQGVDYPIMPIEYDDYASIWLKNLQSTYPFYFYNDMSYPVTNIFLFPVPNAIYPITILSRKPLPQFDNLTTVLNLPQGYARMYVANLALELAPRYQVKAGVDVERIASSSLKQLKALNYVALQQNTGLRQGLSYKAQFFGGL